MLRKVRLQNGETGSALVEFALALSVILTLLLGTVDIGRALYAYDWLSNASRVGTRYMMVRGNDCADSDPHLTDGCPATKDDLTNYLKTDAIGIDTSQLTVDASCTGPSYSGDPPCGVTSIVTVKLTYTFSFLSPFSPHTWTMTSQSERTVLH